MTDSTTSDRQQTEASHEEALPITAIIPVLNCGHRMAEHMEKSMEWLSKVAEIVVVDSHSEDDTIDIIREHAGHLNLRIITHPKGLYESWNKGVEEAKETFVYFSTVGDYITLKGLRDLHESATRFDADVVISPPEFKYESDAIRRKTKEHSWPIHEMIYRIGLKEPTLMDPWQVYDFVLIYLEQSVLGSSASNLYRRSILMEHPFSDDFMSAGDSAWIIKHNFEARIVIHPESISTYLFHIKDWSHDADHRTRGARLKREFACLAYIKALENTTSLDPTITSAAREMLESRIEQTDAQTLPTLNSLPQNLIRKQDPKTRLLLEKLSAICMEVDHQNLREIEVKHYREKLGALRHLWPPAMILRAKRKKLRRRIGEIRNRLQAS